jgi:hypothetical protein
MSPPPEFVLVQEADVVHNWDDESSRITPPPELSESDQKIMSPPFVRTVWLALTVTLPRALRVISKAEVELVKPLTTFMSPVLSTRMLLCVIAETRSSLKMFAVPETLDWNTPSTKEPCVGLVDVMLIVEAANVGSIVTVVPTNSSAVMPSVWVVVTPDWKPTPVNVATPSIVVAVTDSTAAPELLRKTVVVPALRVTT